MTEPTVSEPALHQVETPDPRRPGRFRVVFEGLENDARKFLSDNYPRAHVEPGSPGGPVYDAHLVGPDRSREVYNGPEGGWGPHPDDVTTPTNAGDVATEAQQEHGQGWRPSFGGNR